MSVILRLARHGQRNRPQYRIVAADKQKKRDGRFIEILGLYDNLLNPPKVTLKEDKIRKWISLGAKPSQLVGDLIKKNFPGLLEDRIKHQRERIVAARRKRKKRAAGKK